MALHSMKMAKYKLKTNLGLQEETSTASVDACIRRLQHLRGDLRSVQGSLGAFVKHQRATYDAGRGLHRSLHTFYTYTATKARSKERPSSSSPSSDGDGASRCRTWRRSRRCSAPAAAAAAGVLDHILEGMQAGVGSELEKWANELSSLEGLEDLKNGPLKKSHDYYLKKITGLEARQFKKSYAATEAAEAAAAAAEFAAMAAAAEEERAAEREAEAMRQSGADWGAKGSAAGPAAKEQGHRQEEGRGESGHGGGGGGEQGQRQGPRGKVVRYLFSG